MASKNTKLDTQPERRESYSYSKSSHRTFGRRGATSHAAFLVPFLQPGLSLVDCGCGPGSITLDLAKVVAPGDVLGIDIDTKALDRAHTLAQERGQTNVRFEQASIYAIPCPDNSIDVVFVHAVLHHLGDPMAALAEASRVLTRGGVIAIREPDFGGAVVGPAGTTMDEVQTHWATLIERNGGNPYLGRNVRVLLHEAGFEEIVGSASYEVHGSAETLAPLREGNTLAPEGTLGSKFLELGLVDETELERLRSTTRAWTEHPGAFWARCWCEAVGRKA